MKRFVALFYLLQILVACSHQPSRDPAANKPMYNPVTTSLLLEAAQQKILFVIPDNLFKDTPLISISDSCRKLQSPEWDNELLGALQVLKSQPQFYSKIHAIQIKRADKSGAQILRDLDGTTYLMILYSKSETKLPLDQSYEFSCDGMKSTANEQSITKISYQWPSKSSIASALDIAPTKPDLEKFKFSTDALEWLAKRRTVFWTRAELLAERFPSGEYYLPQFFNRLSEEIIQNSKNLKELNYWISEISDKSKQAQGLTLFTAKLNSDFTTGIQTDSASPVSRKLNSTSDPTYPYLSYKLIEGKFSLTTLTSLEKCLGQLSLRYKIFNGTSGSFDPDPNGFLYPGYHCDAE